MDTQQHSHSKSEFGLQCCAAPDYHGVNSAHGPSKLPLIALAQQGAKAVGHIVAAEQSIGNHQGEPSIGNRSADWMKRAQSEEASSASGNKCLADNIVRRQITQNRRQ
jgi:hypothetical protein